MSDNVVPIAVARTTPPASASEKLSLGTKLAFGAGDFPAAITATVVTFFQLFFLTVIAGLGPAAAGAILLIVKIWDAINDPFVGWLSDRTRSRFGRRRPWILFGAVPLSIFFFLQWLVPPFDPTGKFIYYLVTAMLFSIAFTVVNVPYTALTPDMTRDYDERTSLNSFRFAFSLGASIIVGASHQGIVDRFGGGQSGYIVAATIWSLLCIPPLIWCFLKTSERYQHEQVVRRENLFSQIGLALQNRPFQFVIGIYLFSWLAVQITSSVIIFYVNYWLQQPELIGLMFLSVQLSAFAFLFIWSAVSRRIGKKAVYIIGMVFWIVVQALLFFVQPEQASMALVLGVFAGVGVATAYLIPWSMMPDVIEYNELKTGHRREGVFYGFMVFLQKLGLAIGLFLVGLALEFQGFDATLDPGMQPESALLAIRVMMGPIPTVVLICGIVLTAFYPLTRKKHAEILAQLRERRGEE